MSNANQIDDKAADWVARMESGHFSETDAAALQDWLDENPRHQGALLRAQVIWQQIGAAADVSDSCDAETPDLSQTEEDSEPPDRAAKKHAGIARRNLLISGLAVAGIGGGTMLAHRHFKNAQTYATGPTEFRRIALHDHSVAQLNTSSSVEVSMNAKLRRVTLNHGEAWFDVAKNPQRPFLVTSGPARVQAIGTSFSVRRTPDSTEVVVSGGTVLLWHTDARGAAISTSAGGIAEIRDSGAPIRHITSPSEVQKKLAWREGKIVLDNESLMDAVRQFNRFNTRQIKITSTALQKEKLVGVYQLDQPESFARNIQTMLHAKIHYNENYIIIE